MIRGGRKQDVLEKGGGDSRRGGTLVVLKMPSNGNGLGIEKRPGSGKE